MMNHLIVTVILQAHLTVADSESCSQNHRAFGLLGADFEPVAVVSQINHHHHHHQYFAADFETGTRRGRFLIEPAGMIRIDQDLFQLALVLSQITIDSVARVVVTVVKCYQISWKK